MALLMSTGQSVEKGGKINLPVLIVMSLRVATLTESKADLWWQFMLNSSCLVGLCWKRGIVIIINWALFVVNLLIVWPVPFIVGHPLVFHNISYTVIYCSINTIIYEQSYHINC